MLRKIEEALLSDVEVREGEGVLEGLVVLVQEQGPANFALAAKHTSQERGERTLDAV